MSTTTEKTSKARRGRVFQRGETWYTDFSYRGQRYKEAAPEAKDEDEALDMLEARRTKAREGRRPAHEGNAFPQLVERFRAHHEATGTEPRTLARWNQVLAHLESYFGSDLAREVPERLDGYVAARRHEGAKPGTIKLELGVLASVFKVARLPRLELPDLKLRNVRKGFMEAAQVSDIAEHLPPPLRAPVWFAFYSGWRKSEVLQLEWRNVDLDRGVVRIDPGCSKNGEGRSFPVGAHPELADLLQRLHDEKTSRASAGQIARFVFSRDGVAPIRDMDDSWKSATKAAGLPGKLFHDLRRSAALNLRRLGLSESDIMEMCGWKTRAMFQRYAIKDEKGLADRLRRAISGATSGPTSAHAAIPLPAKHSN